MYLRGRWLILARIVWIAIVVPTYALFLAYVPAYFASLRLPHVANAQLSTIQPTLSDLQMLHMMGLSLDLYAAYMVALSLIFQFSYASVGILLFWRKSHDRIALLTSFALMMLPFGF